MRDVRCDIGSAVRVHIQTVKDQLADLFRVPLIGYYHVDKIAWTAAFEEGGDLLLDTFVSTFCSRYAVLDDFYSFSLRVLPESTGSALHHKLETLPQTLLSQPQQTKLGGGVGGGFQLYCDGRIVLTAGGGSGGGGDVDPDKRSVSFGYGAGAGVQVAQGYTHRSGVDTFISLGSGGGCHTCESSHSQDVAQDVAVSCGTTADENSLSLSAFQASLRRLRHDITAAGGCDRMVVYGGGGGGGGIVRTEERGIGAGYGYSFVLSSGRGSQPSNDIVQVGSPPVPDLPVSVRSQGTHAVFYQLVNASVTSCGGYADWACVCRETKQRVAACSVADAAKDSSGASNDVAPYCTAVREANATIQAMLTGSCAHAGALRQGDGGDRCPIDGTKVYSKEYFSYDNAAVVVDYLYRVANASTSSPYNWVGATPAVQSLAVEPGESLLRTSVPDTELLGMLAPREYLHAEYAAAVTLAFALLGAFLYLCRCILWVMVHRAHIGRRGYTELP
jgi:hypothetical protein